MEAERKKEFDLVVGIDKVIKDQAVFFHTERVLGKVIAEKRKLEFIQGIMNTINKSKSECKECTCDTASHE